MGKYTGLAREALTGRHMAGHGCFRSNRSCGQLQDVGEPALSAIEAVILGDVLPFYHCPTEALEGRFPGLLSLLVTYFAVGKDAGEEERVAAFFRRLFGSVRVEAMWAVNVVWLQRAPAAPIPASLLADIRELAEEGSGRVREVASWLLGRAEQSEG